MVCPCCGSDNYIVLETRTKPLYVYRRRECNDCGRKFVTHEYVVEPARMRRRKSDEKDTLSDSGDACSDGNSCG